MTTYTYARFPNTHTVHVVKTWQSQTCDVPDLVCTAARKRGEDPVILSASESDEVSANELCPDWSRIVAGPKMVRPNAWRSNPVTPVQAMRLKQLRRVDEEIASLTQGTAADIINSADGGRTLVVRDPLKHGQGISAV